MPDAFRSATDRGHEYPRSWSWLAGSSYWQPVLIDASPAGMENGALAFIPLWLIAAAVNMWIGVNRAGYSYADEFPIFLLIFAIPVTVATWLWWRGL